MIQVQALEVVGQERGQRQVPDALAAGVANIIADIRAGGDEALAAWNKKLDSAEVESFLLPEREWTDAAATVDPDVAAAIRGNLERIRAFHAHQQAVPDDWEDTPGLRLGRRPVPLDGVGCYVPGGRASYPSTALMTVVPAVIAGTRRIVVATPSRPDGSVDATVLFAAREAGATEVLRVGGAHGVAALALGTQSIRPVQAIVGPGNHWVTEAKRQLSHHVRTDAPAGPSELVVVADASARADWVALDMLAQAEHDPDAEVILLTTDAALAKNVKEELDQRAPKADRAAIIQDSLEQNGRILVAEDLATAIQWSNQYGPEHLSLVVEDPRTALEQVTAAGSVFLGPHTPVSLGDYGSGTNHVLPTMGQARLAGGLSVEHFRRWITWQEASRDGLAAVARDVATVARVEGLTAHAEAVEKRVDAQ